MAQEFSKEEICLEDSIRKSYMGVVWSHKIQEKQADMLFSQYKWLERLKIMLSGITASGICSILIWDEFWIKLSSAIISLLTVITTSYLKSFALPGRIASHRLTANKLWLIREKLNLLILNIHLRSKSLHEIENQYTALTNDLAIIYGDAPQTTDSAKKKADKALNITKDNEFSEQAIDINLQLSLRRGNC